MEGIEPGEWLALCDYGSEQTTWSEVAADRRVAGVAKQRCREAGPRLGVMARACRKEHS